MENIGKSLNDDERFKKPSSNDNDNVIVPKLTDEEAEQRVLYLLQKLPAPNNHKKYLFKVVYNLPESVYLLCLETAIEKGRDPYRLFAHLTKREMNRRNVD
jgi:hypothetical protein